MRGVHVVITGRVQGVSFRLWTQREALSRGLAGWVRNRRDGTVEAVFSGEDDAVAAMLETCWDGPDMALVSNVSVSDTAERLAGFEVRSTV